MKKQPNSKRKVLSYIMNIDAKPSEVFPLLCPKRECEWIRTWSCEIIYSDSGYAEDNCIFKTKSPSGNSDDLWVVCKYEKDITIQFVRVDDFRTIRYNITLKEQENGTAKAKWEQIITAINEKGNKVINDIKQDDYDKLMSNIENMLNHFIKTGTAL